MPDYRAACQEASSNRRAGQGAARFGLHRFEPPERRVPDARPIWQTAIDPSVLQATALPCLAGDSDAFDVAALVSLAVCQRNEKNGKEHWLFGDGLWQVRLDIVSGTLTAGPVLLEYHLSGLSRALPRLITLNRLIALSRTGRLPPSLFPVEQRANRWVLVLRTWDALAAGMSQREIACEFFGLGDLPRWRTTAPSWRRRAQRLVEAARHAAATEPYRWLAGSIL